ncbi:response regulator [Altererythrobacter aurantiacus]|uniref:Response regulator n=1 Tax=Parapontixanthobacter aurantiacus TaxID=1463599 RepID=A0A844ZEP3_9SPHN|nr:response regulator [Parapontixanthobacter aurantiacus]MXO86014.1 response regulator [Parapontixanthobacter aurantiacus]
MIVEDDGMIAIMLEDMIDALGQQVAGSANSLSAALAFLQNDTPDAAIVDLRLGEEDSYPVMDRLRNQGIPFAVASGYGANIDTSRCGEPLVLIPKPYVLDDVDKAIQRLFS